MCADRFSPIHPAAHTQVLSTVLRARAARTVLRAQRCVLAVLLSECCAECATLSVLLIVLNNTPLVLLCSLSLLPNAGLTLLLVQCCPHCAAFTTLPSQCCPYVCRHSATLLNPESHTFFGTYHCSPCACRLNCIINTFTRFSRGRFVAQIHIYLSCNDIGLMCWASFY
jgi:hypothetical protein